jgi:hypothetical protein
MMPQHSAVWGYASRFGQSLVKMLDEELKVLGLLHVGDGEIGHVPVMSLRRLLLLLTPRKQEQEQTCSSTDGSI